MYEDYQKGELPLRVEIRDGLTVESKSVREIEYIPDSSAVQQRGLSPAELRHFEATKLVRFLNNHQELTPDQELAFMVSEGLIRVVMAHGTTYKTSSDATVFIQPHLVKEYATMVEKLDQWKQYASKRRYAAKKELEHYEELVNREEANTKEIAKTN